MQVLSARLWAAFLAGAALALVAGAQMRPADSDAPLPVPGQVLSDAEPLPAEDRESAGAVQLRDQPVLARQQQLRGNFEAAEGRTGVSSAISRHVTRLMERSRTWGDVREAEAEQAPR